jgi:GntR family transcriptional regulator, rspAB operon transcriptional repressor
MSGNAIPFVRLDSAVSASDRAYELIRQAILDLTFLPGSALSESALVEQIGVSRTPIRQALQRLEHEQLLQIYPQRGTIVAPLDMAGFREALFTRVSLESAAAAEAARRISQAESAELRAQVRDQAQAVAIGDDDAFFRLNHVFHRRIMAIAGVPNVWSVVDSVKVHLDRFRAGHLTLTEAYPLKPVVREHVSLVAALARRDSASATALMREHIEKVVPRAELLSKRRPDLFAWPPGLVGPARLRSMPSQLASGTAPNFQ